MFVVCDGYKNKSAFFFADDIIHYFHRVSCEAAYAGSACVSGTGTPSGPRATSSSASCDSVEAPSTERKSGRRDVIAHGACSTISDAFPMSGPTAERGLRDTWTAAPTNVIAPVLKFRFKIPILFC
ncbi:hypothetical protein GWI33_007957 [Rhynchophorus ferrugineus]|uniref:Uncharacterized protein n=1 Tax=Rhynchophorus ferrugineus TaxID=354439 RepID=A0A834MEH7_RHYFE|nr:hypothetical protein GWI33_007957 [Rhynchophorus ferrugineus]